MPRRRWHSPGRSDNSSLLISLNSTERALEFATKDKVGQLLAFRHCRRIPKKANATRQGGALLQRPVGIHSRRGKSGTVKRVAGGNQGSVPRHRSIIGEGPTIQP